MAEALFDPVAGFYATKDPLGAGADFITAPEISQMFGELVGLWAVESWRAMGAPNPVRLVELGPGKATMMHDALRAGRLAPDFLHAARVTLVEASPALKMVQARTLADSPVPVDWAGALEDVPAGPSIVLANEFLDCLPIRQAVKHEGRWRERCVGIDPEDETGFAFMLGAALGADETLIPAALRGAPDGTLVELRPGDAQIVETLAGRFRTDPGRALFIDYGAAESEAGDTLQAIRAHEKVDPLDAPGTADLTAWVDFARLAETARAAGLAVHGPAGQGDFLAGLGIEARAAALAQTRPDRKATIARQLHRLTDPAEMGALFKVMAISSPALPDPPGLSPYPDGD
ncbi:SAM-dependent methyltransferase [Marinicauda salina]|uniref:SAM-dependent methyltransferase n=2 Tax=Marinicauda salina TaxID=2135793 RepID=A0A2U2BS73_9PROT|nr:SAM-dependent methyltransferase [Marinicauda salina]